MSVPKGASSDNTMLDTDILFRTMPIPRFIMRVDGPKSFVVERMNDLALLYFDCDEADAVGVYAMDFMDIENARHFEQSFQVSLSRTRTVTIQALPTAAADIKIHGFSVAPLHNDKGEITHLDVLGQVDIRDQSILQRERDDAISLLASIFEVSEVGIIVTDEASKVIRVNDSFVRTYGWSRDKVVGQAFTNLIAEDERERMRVNHKKFISVGVRSTGEAKMLRRDGGEANVLFTSATLRLSQDRKLLVTTVMDITLRKQMELSLRIAKDQADAANRSKSTFLANMSHELRTPLNAIIGFSELMIKETFGKIENDKYKEYLDDVHMSAEHLLGIINEVLDMSKIEAGQLELTDEDFDIHDVIVSVCRMMSSRVFANNIKIEREIADGLPGVHADYRLMRQVLINLITNAIKFSPAGAVIYVRAFLDDKGRMVIQVQDQGVGIHADKIERALEPFGQVNDGPLRRDVAQQGTGLGLPLAKAMIEMHGGKFNLSSEVDVGTVVSFSLPSTRVVK